MSTEIENTANTPAELETPEFGLSIDQPTPPLEAFSRPEYDGAAPSEEPAAETPATPVKKLRIDMGNGKYYTADTERELLQKVVDGKKEADRYIEELKALKAAPPAGAANVTVKPRTPVNNSDLPETYDNQKYLTMLGEDPIKAARYINREIYGGDPEEMLRHSYAVANQVQQHMAVAEFRRRNQSYVASDENGQAILDIARENGLDATNVPALEWAYMEGQRTGRITSGTVNAEGEVEYEDISFSKPAPVVSIAKPAAPAGHQRRGASAPKSPGGGGGGGTTPTPIDPYSMPLEDLRKAIESKGGLHR